MRPFHSTAFQVERIEADLRGRFCAKRGDEADHCAIARPHIEQLARALDSEILPEVIVPVVQLLGRIGPPAQAALPELRKIANEHPGDVSDAAAAAIQLISGDFPATSSAISP